MPQSYPPLLSPHECLLLAQKIAKDEDLWRRFVHFDEENRYFRLLKLDNTTEVWLLCWVGSNDTGWHDHGASGAGVVVVEGEVMEEVLMVTGVQSRRLNTDGHIVMERGDIHRMYAGPDKGITIHVYSPPLGRVGQYITKENGELYRLEQDGSTPLHA